MSPLSATKDRSKTIRRGRTTDVVAVDLTGERVKLVRGRRSAEGVSIDDVRQQSFSEGQEDEISKFLVQSFKALKITKKRAICVVSSKSFITKNVDIPSNNREEIGKIIDLQAGRLTPYSRDEIVIDYICMENPEQHYTNVLLIIMHRKVISRFYRIFEKAGIEIDRIAISPEGLANAYDNAADFKIEQDAVGGIHIGEDVSDLTISDKQLVFVRSIPIGAAHFKKNNLEAQAEFLRQLNKSVVAYQNQGVGRPIKSLFLTGLMKSREILSEKIKQSVPYIFASNIPIKIISYVDHFKILGSVGEEVKADTETSYCEVLSCLAASDELKIDLAPREIKLKRKVQEGGKEVVSFAITVMSLMLLITVFLGGKIFLKNSLLQKLEVIHEASFEQARVLEQTSTKSRFMRSLLQGRGKALFVFERISDFIGAEIYLKSFKYTDDGVMQFAGTAESMSRVFSFVTDLEKSNYFESVTTHQTKSRVQAGKDVADFELEIKMRDGF